MDWKTIKPADVQAGPEGDRIIAEAFGYSVVRSDDTERPPAYCLSDDTRQLYFPAALSEQAAWVNGPDYTTSVDAALGLPLDGMYRFTLSQQHNGVWHAQIMESFATLTSAVNENKAWFGKSKTELAALALCRAWLAWKQAQK